MTVAAVLDSAGRRRSPATMPGYHTGRPPQNKGMRYPAPRERNGRLGLGAAAALARRPLRAARWLAGSASSTVQPAAGPVKRRCARRALPARRSGRCAAPVRAPPAAPRARARPRGRRAEHHPAPARTREPRHHLELPPRHRYRRNHRHAGRRPPRRIFRDLVQRYSMCEAAPGGTRRSVMSTRWRGTSTTEPAGGRFSLRLVAVVSAAAPRAAARTKPRSAARWAAAQAPLRATR